MLTSRELTTVRAALLYWQEEMCPHPAVMPPYFQPQQVQPLADAETEALRERFAEEALRYMVCDPLSGNLIGELYSSAEAAAQFASGDSSHIATVIF